MKKGQKFKAGNNIHELLYVSTCDGFMLKKWEGCEVCKGTVCRAFFKDGAHATLDRMTLVGDYFELDITR